VRTDAHALQGRGDHRDWRLHTAPFCPLKTSVLARTYPHFGLHYTKEQRRPRTIQELSISKCISEPSPNANAYAPDAATNHSLRFLPTRIPLPSFTSFTTVSFAGQSLATSMPHRGYQISSTHHRR
jgi:hypothetical protein